MTQFSKANNFKFGLHLQNWVKSNFGDVLSIEPFFYNGDNSNIVANDDEIIFAQHFQVVSSSSLISHQFSIKILKTFNFKAKSLTLNEYSQISKFENVFIKSLTNISNDIVNVSIIGWKVRFVYVAPLYPSILDDGNNLWWNDDFTDDSYITKDASNYMSRHAANLPSLGSDMINVTAVSSQPQWTPSGVVFNNSWLQSTYPEIITTPITTYILFKFNRVGVSEYDFLCDGITGSGRLAFLTVRSPLKYSIVSSNPIELTVLNTQPSTDYTIVSLLYNNDDSNFNINNVSQDIVIGTNSVDGCRLGSAYSKAFGGDFNLLAFGQRANLDTPEQRNEVSNYLINKHSNIINQ